RRMPSFTRELLTAVRRRLVGQPAQSGLHSPLLACKRTWAVDGRRSASDPKPTLPCCGASPLSRLDVVPPLRVLRRQISDSRLYFSMWPEDNRPPDRGGSAFARASPFLRMAFFIEAGHSRLHGAYVGD